MRRLVKASIIERRRDGNLGFFRSQKDARSTPSSQVCCARRAANEVAF
jgi:hypothetical protein